MKIEYFILAIIFVPHTLGVYMWNSSHFGKRHYMYQILFTTCKTKISTCPLRVMHRQMSYSRHKTRPPRQQPLNYLRISSSLLLILSSKTTTDPASPLPPSPPPPPPLLRPTSSTLHTCTQSFPLSKLHHRLYRLVDPSSLSRVVNFSSDKPFVVVIEFFENVVLNTFFFNLHFIFSTPTNCVLWRLIHSFAHAGVTFVECTTCTTVYFILDEYHSFTSFTKFIGIWRQRGQSPWD